MKIGVLKLGARISFSSQGTSGGTGEALSIIRMLTGGGGEVVVFTKILNKDENPDSIEFRNIEDEYSNINDLECLVVINGTVQFYGGAEDRSQLLNYEIINNFKGPVFYILCDPELTFKQVWPSVSKKPWGSAWEESMLNVVRADIRYISQPFDVDKVLADLKKNEVVPSTITHFPFEKFPCLNDRLEFNPTPTVDLSYGGTMRGGKRMKKMAKFYFGHPSDISVEMFGKIKEEDFKPDLKFGLTLPAFTGPVRYDEMLPKMNQAMCHCVIGDPWYEKINDVPQRLYESIWSSVITFVDADMDKLRRVYGIDKNLADFLYVNDRQELSEKIQLLKSDPSTRRQILQDQVKAVRFVPEEYCSKFVQQIEKLL